MFQSMDLTLKIYQFLMEFYKVLFMDHYYFFFTSMICILLSNFAEFDFADDNLLYISKSIKKLNKFVNFDLKNLSNWLINAKKISLNVSKTELVMFKPRMKKILT